uniref:G protein-coupled receptor n=1 Tax=Steinernema glaseri TaxID=37863 RepID=A0A1I7ZRN8_9BILA
MAEEEIEMAPSVRTAVAIFEMIQLPLCLPLYAALIWIFATKPDFKNILAYKILINMCILDCLYLFQGFMDGVFRIAQTAPNKHLGAVSRCDKVTAHLLLNTDSL